MKKIFSLLIISIFCSTTAIAEELYLACVTSMIEDRSTIKVPTVGEDKRFGFQYFKFDNAKSEITIHEQIQLEKPTKVGSKVIDYIGKDIIEFEIKGDDALDTYKLTSWDLSDKDSWQDFKFESSIYIKYDSDTIDYDFKSLSCIPPLNEKDRKMLKASKAKRLYKKWIRKGFSTK